MATAAVRAQGVLLKMENDAGGTFTTVAEVLSISGPTMSRDQIDVTNQDSTGNVREFINGLMDPGEITFDINYLTENATHDDTTDGLLGVFSSGDSRAWELHLPGPGSGVKYGFNAIVNGFEVGANVEEQLKASVTLKISGSIDFSKA